MKNSDSPPSDFLKPNDPFHKIKPAPKIVPLSVSDGNAPKKGTYLKPVKDKKNQTDSQNKEEENDKKSTASSLTNNSTNVAKTNIQNSSQNKTSAPSSGFANSSSKFAWNSPAKTKETLEKRNLKTSSAIASENKNKPVSGQTPFVSASAKRPENNSALSSFATKTQNNSVAGFQTKTQSNSLAGLQNKTQNSDTTKNFNFKTNSQTAETSAKSSSFSEKLRAGSTDSPFNKNTATTFSRTSASPTSAGSTRSALETLTRVLNKDSQASARLPANSFKDSTDAEMKKTPFELTSQQSSSSASNIIQRTHKTQPHIPLRYGEKTPVKSSLFDSISEQNKITRDVSSILSSSSKSLPKEPQSPDYYSDDIESEGLTNFEFNSLRDFLYKQSGIYVTNTRRYLFKNRLVGRLSALNLKTYKEYYLYLSNNDPQKKELNKFYEQMTTNETSFFRNTPQLETFDELVLRKLLSADNPTKKLRILSAGCSSGEEPYTLAIMIYEILGQNVAKWDIKILARDLSPAVLKAAREGMYNSYTLRTTPKAYIEKYFAPHGELYKINPELKRLVDFGQINLNDKKQMSQLEQSHIIFCRNVIIYFDDEVKTNVVQSFYDNLLPNGFLIIGHSESLNTIPNSFAVSHHKNTQIYKKNA